MSLCFTQHFCKNDVTVLEMKLFGVSGEGTTADHNFGDSLEKKLFPLREQQVSREEFLVVTCLYSGFPVW